MALGDLVACKRGLKGGIMTEQRMGLRMPLFSVPDHNTVKQAQSANVRSTNEETDGDTGIVYLPQTVFLSGLRWDACKGFVSAGSADIGLVSKWRMKDRMKTGCVALVLCLNIGVDPPDAIRISPCARTECWIDPFSFPSHKALEAIGKTLQLQYKQWQPKAPPPHKVELDPTVDAVKQLCLQSRESAKSDRVLFHYNGHGVPKPTENGNIWVFNKNCTQYIPLSFYDLESWLGMPALYVFDCSAAGMILKTFCERPEWAFSGSSTSALRSCILLAACGSQEVLPQHSDLPADIFTSCLTTPIKVALKWFCRKSLLQPAVNPELIDKIPGRQDDRKTPLGELNWIFTAVTDTIAWNVLPPELFQRLFRQDLLVASLFRNFLLAERVMRSANCTPQSYPTIPRTHQHPMWHAWDMAAEMCLSQFPAIINNFTEFKPSSFFSEQLTAFEVWLEHGSERKRPPEQLPIVLQVVLSKSHRARALMLLGRFLDLGAWAIDLALSVGIFPCVLKLLQTTTVEIRQILVFIWTKLLALDKSCQVDLVKDGRHLYFIRFLDSPDVYGEQRAMSAFVLAVIVDGYQRGQEVCMQAGLISICLKHAKYFSTVEGHSEPLLLQCLCLCLGKIWDSFPDAQQLGFEGNAPVIFMQLLTEAQPEVRASAIFALGTLISSGNMVSGSCPTSDDEDEDFERHQAEHEIASTLLTVLFDGSPLVRSELAIALSRFASSHNNQFRRSAASYAPRSAESSVAMKQNLVLRVSYKGAAVSKEQNAISSLHGSPSSEDLVNSVTRRQGEGDNLYMQCISALFVLETDPCAQVARIGEQVLQTIGIDLQCACDVRAGSGSSRSRSPSLSPSRSHHRNSSAGSVPWNIVSGLPRSVSWINLNSGNLTTMFRTPPASPPTQKSVLAGNGMRRVYSLEFSRHTQQTTDAGLADATVIGTPQVFRSETVPSSTLYSWSCSHFSRPLIEPSCFDDEEILLRRQDRERLALDGIAKCEQSSVARVSDQVASWDTGAQNSVEAVMLHPFMQVVCSIDEHEVLRVWDYEKGFLMNAFENHNVAEKGVSRLFLLNELDDDLLLVASSDGTVRVWKDYMEDNMQCLVTAWQAVTPRLNASKAVVDWQQLTGYLYASCEKSPIMVWDLNRELRACNLISQSDSSISALSASPILSQHVTAGYSDGSIRVFDLRSPDIVCTIAPHKQRIVGLDFLPGKDTDKIVSASVAGDLKFIDMRNTATPYLDVDACVDTLSAIAVHRHAPLIAIGSAKQYIKVFNEYGKLISELRHVHNSFFAQKLGSICALSFHPYKVYLAAGATDSFVSIYSGNDDQFI